MGIYKLFFGQGWEQSIFFYLAAVGLLVFAIGLEWSDVLKYKRKLKNSNTFLQQPIPRSHWRFVPGILTAIGVLGTFYGITAGLADISLNNIGGDSQNLLKSSVTLLEGMKTAFATSLVGLGSSSIFTLFLAYCDGERRKAKDSLRNELANRNPDDNQGASQSLADAAKKMGDAAEQMGTKFAELIKIQRQLSPQAIGQEVGNVMKPVFQEIRVELKALREIKADQGQEILRNLIEEQREQLIKPIIGELRNSATLTKGASEAVMDLKNELGGISRSLSESIVTIQQFQVDTIGQLQQFALNLESILGEFRTDTKDVLQQVATEVKEAVNQSIVAMKNQQNAFDASAKQAATTFIGIREQLEKSLETQAQIQRDSIQEFQNSSREIFAEQSTNLKQVGEEASQAMILQRNAFTASAKQTAATFRGVREELEKSLETQAQIQRDSIQEFQNSSREIFEQQANNLKLVGNAASQQMNEARENLTATLTNIDNVLQNTRLTVQEELQTFRLNYQAALQEFFMQQNQLLEGTLGEQRQGLADVVTNFQKVFEEEYNRRKDISQEMQESLIKIKETTAQVNKFAHEIGLISGERFAQLQELARTIGKEASHVEKAYENLSREFNGGLQSWNQEMMGYFQRKSESDMKFFTQADEATARVCNQLVQAANYLVAAESTRRNSNEQD
ncbi:hypothetical protein [Kamptonema sp. UHCC 0994]|uniref:hypothetical protein n=1 Tax=Kamptonema sp. UHCC 0994 TaxID=3031329 RepID=UPI0023BABC91|nr:hypothetical protein [Kamptonema sp. UHCC 0994]MDF0556078.1 hypothetical protein [Kamptonema sp. UHCC 0994]